MTPLTLAVSPVSLQCVSFGAYAAVRAWQVDTLPLTFFLQALIYICVEIEQEERKSLSSLRSNLLHSNEG